MKKEIQAKAVPPMPLQEAHLREFLSKGVITRVTATGKADGFELHVLIGEVVGALVNAKGGVRTFSSLNTLAGLLRRMGTTSFDVAIGDFSAEDSEPSAPKSVPKKNKQTK